MDQELSFQQIVEKYKERKKDLFLVFMDVEKANVRVGKEVSKHFDEKWGLSQGCMTSPWMFTIWVDKAVKGMKDKTILGVSREQNGIKDILYGDNTVLIAESNGKLRAGWCDEAGMYEYLGILQSADKGIKEDLKCRTWK